MSRHTQGSFAAAVALHERLLRQPDPHAVSAALQPDRLATPTQWTPDLLPLRPYESVDPASLGLAGHDDFHVIPDAVLDAAIARVVDTEGPVHFDVLADRLLEGAGVGRLGSRIRARIEARLEAMMADIPGTGVPIDWHQGFVARPTQHLKPAYRDWREAPDKTRQLEYVSDEELMLALFRAVLDADCGERESAMNEGIHAIGFIRLTNNARTRLETPLEALLGTGLLVDRGGKLGVTSVLGAHRQCS